MTFRPQSSPRTVLSPQIITGVILIAFWWPISWLRVRPVSDFYFFPLWLGYILTVDGLVKARTGTSLLSRSRKKFALLFLCSIPFWWLFEWMNQYLNNWHYQTAFHQSVLDDFLLGSLAFSTVVPAVLEMSELVASFGFGERLPSLPAWRSSSRWLAIFEVIGWLMVALVILFPHYTFPLAWISIFFILEPINVVIRQRSIAWYVSVGNWAALWNIMLATVVTGFFWEMWNFYSLPKWSYTIPFVGFAHVFEMPVLGYFGYIPFGLEVFAMFGLVFMLFLRRPQHYAIVSRWHQNKIDDGQRSDHARSEKGRATADV